MAFGTGEPYICHLLGNTVFREKRVKISSNVSNVDAEPVFNPFVSGKGNGKFTIHETLGTCFSTSIKHTTFRVLHDDTKLCFWLGARGLYGTEVETTQITL